VLTRTSDTTLGGLGFIFSDKLFREGEHPLFVLCADRNSDFLDNRFIVAGLRYQNLNEAPARSRGNLRSQGRLHPAVSCRSVFVDSPHGQFK
jgi:hypothetical protein